MKGGPARSSLVSADSLSYRRTVGTRDEDDTRLADECRVGRGRGAERRGRGVRMDVRGERFSTRDRFRHLLGGLRVREGCIRASFRSDGVAGEPLMRRRSGP